MNPQNSSQGGDGLGPTGPSTPQNSSPQDQQSAAANVIRTQIDALYGGRTIAESRPVPARNDVSQQRYDQTIQATQAASVAQTTPVVEPALASQSHDNNPYHRNHTDHPQPEAEQWKAYHSAWQDYYQKYYEGYYNHKKAQEEAAQQATQAAAEPQQSNSAFFSDQVKTSSTATEQMLQNEEDITKDQALFELRQKLLGKVRGQASKIRGSKHFIPVVAALSVVLIFVFLQYNRVFLATVNAYVSPGSLDPQNIVIDPSAGTSVGPDSKLIIPKINVDVPALYDVGSDHASQMKAMESGVAHFAIPGANSHPGEIGNTVLSGHSSNDLFDGGDYKFIFAQLEKLQKGDTIYANYGGKRYTYVVTKTEVVKPSNVQALIYPTDKPILTLITCTPLGTAQDRLLITAEQISPDPAAAATAPVGSGTITNADSNAIPGSSPTLLERLFGAR